MPQDPALALPRAMSPVETIETDAPDRKSEEGVALCLSGGGYRAMLFHLGALWRVNELGYLPKLKRISSVSGGSITAGVLGLHWDELDFQGGVAQRFQRGLVDPVRSLAGDTIDAVSIIRGIVTFDSVAERVTEAYRKHLFGNKTLQDLPAGEPRFVINATNVQSKVLWRFSRPYMRDYRVGQVKNPTTELAVAVAASSAFPPFLSPLEMKMKDSDFTPGTGLDLQRPPFTTNVVLTDGGVYDNLGLETVWKRYTTILVSDGGGATEDEEEPHHDWARHTYRILNLIDNQVRSLRKRQVIDSYKSGARKGAYWGIRTDIANYGVGNVLPAPLAKTIVLANTPTRLKALPDQTQERIINWGYAVCDAAMRAHVDSGLPAPVDFPYPGTGVG